MKGWLVKWTTLGSEYDETVATILSARLGLQEVARRMEQFYAHVTASLQEKLDYARYSKPAPLPYRARSERLKDGRHAIYCGYDPWLEARLVDGLRVETTEDGVDVLHYVDGQEKKSIVELPPRRRLADVSYGGLPGRKRAQTVS